MTKYVSPNKYLIANAIVYMVAFETEWFKKNQLALSSAYLAHFPRLEANDCINIGSENGLTPSANNPLCESLLVNTVAAIWRLYEVIWK